MSIAYTIPPKAEKSLVLWDLDNTLTDTLFAWSTATWPAVNALTRELNLDHQKLIEAIRLAPGQFRFCDFGRLLDWLDENGHLGIASNPAEADHKRTTKIMVRDFWFAQQRKHSVFYPGAMETMRMLHTKGATQVIDTDAEASSLIRRFWLMAHNARLAGMIKDEIEILDMVSHFYAQPSIECDRNILRDVDLAFIYEMKRKMSIWTDGTRKPNPDHVSYILADFAASPEKTIYIGDTHKDGGGAKPASVDFIWYRPGADIDAQSVHIAKMIASPKYKYGIADISASFNDASRAKYEINSLHAEIFAHFEFIPGPVFTAREDALNLDNGQSQSGSPHIPAGQSGQAVSVKRIARLFHTQGQIPPLGPPTHHP